MVAELPGVYVLGDGRLAVVSADAAAGDTASMVTAAVEAWLDRLGSWSYLSEVAISAAMTSGEGHRAIGWPLLVAAAVLLVFETALARWFSHASAGGGGTMGRWLWAQGLGLVRPGSGQGEGVLRG